MHRRAFLTGTLATPTLIGTAGLVGTAATIGTPAQAADSHRVRELYDGHDMSAFATGNQGNRLTFQGFMAPPLKAQSRFFVLTKMPMSVCPFCETEAEWPSDILAVYTKRVVDPLPFNVKIEARGVLELGSFRDPDTGFLSLVRLTDATFG